MENVYGFSRDGGKKPMVFENNLPPGGENISIEDLPIGTNLVSFSRTRTGKGVVYDIESKENGWSFILREPALPNSRYFLNGRPINSSSSGIRMEGRKNRVLISTSDQ